MEETLIGRTISHYRIDRLLGVGGMGRVYLGADLNMGERRVAIKLLHEHLGLNAKVRERFKQEALILGHLSHPNTVTVHEFLVEHLMIVMEFVEGAPLDAILIQSQGPLPLPRTMSIFDQVLSALAYAHQREVVHRDLKPANVMVTQLDGRDIAKIMDFGIAKILGDAPQMTATSAKLGTMWYSAPEQIENPAGVDARADIYALGISLYEAATGRVPFPYETDYAIMRAHIEEAPPPPREIHSAVPKILEAVILKSIAKAPQDRFATAHEMRMALQRAAATCGMVSQHTGLFLQMEESAANAAVPAPPTTGQPAPAPAREEGRAATPGTSREQPQPRTPPAGGPDSSTPPLAVAQPTVFEGAPDSAAKPDTGRSVPRAAAQPTVFEAETTSPPTSERPEPPDRPMEPVVRRSWLAPVAIAGTIVVLIVATLALRGGEQYPRCDRNADCDRRPGEICVDGTCSAQPGGSVLPETAPPSGTTSLPAAVPAQAAIPVVPVASAPLAGTTRPPEPAAQPVQEAASQPAAEPHQPAVEVGAGTVPQPDPPRPPPVIRLETAADVYVSQADEKAAKDWNTQGMRAYKRQDYHTALSHFSRAVQLNPNHRNYWFNVGCQSALLGDVAGAIRGVEEWARRRHDRDYAAMTQVILVERDLDRVRHDPRFQDWMRKIAP